MRAWLILAPLVQVRHTTRWTSGRVECYVTTTELVAVAVAVADGTENSRQGGGSAAGLAANKIGLQHSILAREGKTRGHACMHAWAMQLLAYDVRTWRGRGSPTTMDKKWREVDPSMTCSRSVVLVHAEPVRVGVAIWPPLARALQLHLHRTYRVRDSIIRSISSSQHH